MKSLIVANWKCNPTSLKKAKRLFNLIKKGIKSIKNTEVVICPSFVHIPILGAFASIRQKASFCRLALGSQDCFWEGKGAFTGEISPLMLKDLGCRYVILGHSERRKYLIETDEMINKKMKKVLEFGLKSIICIGEKKGEGFDILKSQLQNGLKGISKKNIKNIIVAYEPIFAIGTGKSCSLDKVLSVSLFIRKMIYKKYGRTAAENLKILYGGSINKENAKSYITEAGVNGLLVGGASLKADEFVAIAKRCGVRTKISKIS